MAIRSVEIVRHPRKIHTCEICRQVIDGVHLRLYNPATDTRKYHIRVHPHCVEHSDDEKVVACLREINHE